MSRWMVVLVAANVLSACEGACPILECASMLVISVADVPPGDRDFDVVVTMGETEATCSGPFVDGVLACDALTLTEVEGGYEILMASAGEEAHLSLGWDGAVQVDEDLDVDWDGDPDPSGDQCPGCVSGTASVDVPGER